MIRLRIILSVSLVLICAMTPFVSFGQTNQVVKEDFKVQAEQVNSATQPTVNPAVSIGSVVVGQIVGSITGVGRTKGFQFKDPHAGAGATYRSTDDTTPTGFSDNEYSGDISFDADVYDGLILGGLYQHTYRGGYNAIGTSEHLDSNAISVYAAKRYFNILNTGISYNFVGTDHRLTRASNVNLDRDSHGFTAFIGASDRIGKWAWATTPSLTYVNDNYDKLSTLETAVFTWSNSLSYDVSKQWNIGAAFSVSQFVVEDTFANSSIRDDNYWNIGPRIRFYPTQQWTFSLDFDSQQGFEDYRAYTVRLGADYSF